MKEFEKILKERNIKNIIFDFDGVILDSIPVKTEAFRKLFEKYPKELVEKFIEFHLENGGMSRYEKIRYFFEELLNKNITDEQILDLANRYSTLTKIELSNKKYLIKEVIDFIISNYKKHNMHIASGADENDLKYICNKLDLNKYFLSINGSPIKKRKIVKNILNINNYEKDETILIGDSINDYYAANVNTISFYGFNNELLKIKHEYINEFKKTFIF